MLFPRQVEGEEWVGNVGRRWLQGEGKRVVEVRGLSGAYRADAEVAVLAVRVVLGRAGTGVQLLQAVVLHSGIQGRRAVYMQTRKAPVSGGVEFNEKCVILGRWTIWDGSSTTSEETGGRSLAKTVDNKACGTKDKQKLV